MMKYYGAVRCGLDYCLAIHRKSLYKFAAKSRRRVKIADSTASFNLLCYSRIRQSAVCADLSGRVACLNTESAAAVWTLDWPGGVFYLCLWESPGAVFVGGRTSGWFCLNSGTPLQSALWRDLSRSQRVRSTGSGIVYQQGPLIGYLGAPEGHHVALAGLSSLRYACELGAEYLLLDESQSENRLRVFDRSTGVQSGLISLPSVKFIRNMRTLPDASVAILCHMDTGQGGLWRYDGQNAELIQVFKDWDLAEIAEDGKHVISSKGEWLPVS